MKYKIGDKVTILRTLVEEREVTLVRPIEKYWFPGIIKELWVVCLDNGCEEEAFISYSDKEK